MPAAQADYVRALHLPGAATSLHKSTGALRGAAKQQRFEQRRVAVEQALGLLAAAEHWQAGRAIPLEPAINYVLEP